MVFGGGIGTGARPRTADRLESGDRPEAQRHRLAGSLRHGWRRGVAQISLPVDLSRRDVAARRRHAVHLLELRPPLDRRRRQLGDDQPGSDPQRPEQDRLVRRTDHRRQQRRRNLLHDLRLPRVAARSGRVLGGLGRRADPPLARRRPDLAERHAAGAAGVGDDQHDRAVAARRGHARTSPRPCYKSDDTRPYLYRTNDYGATWTRITGGIADDEFTRVDPRRPEPSADCCTAGPNAAC